jgi:hypothetical protein
MKIKPGLILTIAVLAAIAIVFSPLGSILQGKLLSPTMQVIVTSPEPPKLTESDIAYCSSMDTTIHDYVNSNNTEDAEDASTLLLAEFCNRPDLIAEMNSSAIPEIRLVSYACDTAKGNLEDRYGLQDSLEDYTEIYCSSSREVILDEAGLLLADVQGFRNDTIAESQDAVGNGSTNNSTDALVSSLDAIIDDINTSIAFADSSPYQAAKVLDKALSDFNMIIEEQGVSTHTTENPS